MLANQDPRYIFIEWIAANFSSLGVVASIGILTISAIVFRYTLRKERIAQIDKNLDLLQRFNETALSSDANLEAAIKSVRRDDNIGIDEARLVFIQYLRINRIYRAYLIHEAKLISDVERDLLVKNYAGTLKEFEFRLPDFLKRGYDPDFESFLLEVVQEAEEVPILGSSTPEQKDQTRV